jgi:hypothetical protein
MALTSMRGAKYPFSIPRQYEKFEPFFCENIPKIEIFFGAKLGILGFLTDIEIF